VYLAGLPYTLVACDFASIFNSLAYYITNRL
jgi:hypothetical protein